MSALDDSLEPNPLEPQPLAPEPPADGSELADDSGLDDSGLAAEPEPAVEPEGLGETAHLE